MVLVRFAPSPTGPLHLGGLRMALYNHLFARRNNGKWILRIEDTDKSRYVQGSTEGIRRCLEWAGLDFDFGPGRDGPHGPYFQSERLDLYRKYASKLIESGHAYRCFCTPDQLSNLKEKLARSGSSASYDRTCLHLTDEEIYRKLKAGEKHTVRFNNTSSVSRNPPSDMIFRTLKDAHASLATDPIILKSDSYPTYHLASIVDDHEMGITHVLRGEEWITSFGLHLDLYSALNLDPPRFAHFPILLNPDGSKMSKRHGDIRVDDFIKRGWEPDAVLNWLLLCGYGVRHDSSAEVETSHLESNKIMDLKEMVDLFDTSAITQRNTILEASNLHYINKHHLMRRMKDSDGLLALARRVETRVRESFPESLYTDRETIAGVIALLEGRLVNLFDLPEVAPYFFTEPDKGDILETEKGVYGKVVKHASERFSKIGERWEREEIHDVVQSIGREVEGVNSRLVMRILRRAITGMKEGPALVDVIEFIGRDRTLRRLSTYSEPFGSLI